MAKPRVSQSAAVRVERLDGEIDIARVPALMQRFSSLNNEFETLALDLSSVTFLDSSGIALLHELSQRLRVRSQQLVVISPPGTMPRRVLDLTAFGTQVTLEDSVAAIDRQP